MAGAAGGILERLLGGSSFISQIFLYQVVGQVVSALLGPYMTQAGYDVNRANPLIMPSPPDLAQMVVKNILTEDQAAQVAAAYGEDAEKFHWRVLDTGEPPGLQQVLEWWRRGFLPWDGVGPGEPSVENAIRTSRTYTYWTPVIQRAQFLPITVADAVNAWVRGQISPDEAKRYIYENGLLENEAQILFDTTGRPPAPMQLATLVRRGLIPVHGSGPGVTSFQQGIIEGDLKDKWEPQFEGLIEAIPGIFEIRQAQISGGMTAQMAAKYYAMQGLPPDITAAMVEAGTGAKLAGSKKLAQGTIMSLYADKVLSRDQAAEFLVQLGYDEPEADFVIDVQDYKEAAASVSSAISKTRTGYLARKLDLTQARQILDALGVPADRAQQLLAIWEDELGATVRILTPGQIVDAVYYGVSTTEWAMQQLEGLGYTPGDAWVLISVRLHGPAPDPPPDAPPAPPPPPPVTATPAAA